MIYLCINLYKSVTKVGNIFHFCKKNLIFFSKTSNFLLQIGRFSVFYHLFATFSIF